MGAIIKRRIESTVVQTPSAYFRHLAAISCGIMGLILSAGKGTYFLSSNARWLSDITTGVAVGHGSTELLEREAEINIQ